MTPYLGVKVQKIHWIAPLRKLVAETEGKMLIVFVWYKVVLLNNVFFLHKKSCHIKLIVDQSFKITVGKEIPEILFCYLLRINDLL